MDLFTAIDTRASALTLSDPAPTLEHLQRILAAGARAPDHGKLAPWRFVIVTGPSREILGNAMAHGLLAREPQASAEQLQRERDKAVRAPCIIAVAASIKQGHKVPEIEQVTAVAAATQNMFLAAHALGYGAMWKTGPAAYASQVKAALGLQAADHIVALLYLGAIATPGKARAAVLEERVQWLV